VIHGAIRQQLPLLACTPVVPPVGADSWELTGGRNPRNVTSGPATGDHSQTATIYTFKNPIPT